jgi:hypothetical protein
MATRLAMVSSLPIAPVVFVGSSGQPLVAPRTRAVDVSLADDFWDVSQTGVSNKVSVDVLARGVPLASWLFLDVDARAEHWTSRQNPVFLPTEKSHLYVWQAELTAMPSEALTLSAGRILPWGVPGATVFDGGMAGWHGRWHDFTVEAGGFGGLVPEPDTTDPTTQRATAGGYWTLDRHAGGVTFRTEGRVAAVKSPELGTRGEASLTARFFQKKIDASAEATLGFGGKVTAPGSLDSGRADLTARPVTWFALGGSFAYSGLKWPQTFTPDAFPGRSRQATGFATFDIRPWLRVGATGGWGTDLDSSLDRTWFGPEVSLPNVLWKWGSIAAGYLEERGWMPGGAPTARSPRARGRRSACSRARAGTTTRTRRSTPTSGAPRWARPTRSTAGSPSGSPASAGPPSGRRRAGRRTASRPTRRCKGASSRSPPTRP